MRTSYLPWGCSVQVKLILLRWTLTPTFCICLGVYAAFLQPSFVFIFMQHI
jgi:hypothetical protein